jgi:hypothetical protein
MGAAEYNLNIDQGSSYNLTLVYKDKDKNVIPITNWCARMIITTSDNQVITYKSGTSNSEYKMYIEGVNGKIVLMLPALTTNNFTFKSAKYDLELESDDIFYTSGGQYVTRIMYGSINIQKRNSKLSINMEC